MATSLTLKTGQLTATKTTNNDATAQEIMLRFAHATGAQRTWTNQQKLDHVTGQLVEYMLRIARERYIQEESSTIQATAMDAVKW
jgi:hypothetical protein